MIQMSSMSNIIERYLKQLLEQSETNYIEIQRNELANKFKCVPSQINYVLSTRFTLSHGFVVESRRGGGGYIRILRIPIQDEMECLAELNHLVGEQTSQQQAVALLKRLLREKIITNREYNIMKAAIDRSVLKVDLPWRDRLRANILIAMLEAVAKETK